MKFDRWVKRKCQHAVKPVLLCVNSLSVVSIYSWFRLFDLLRKANGDGVAAFWAIALSVAALVCVLVFTATWRVEWGLARAFAAISRSRMEKMEAKEAKDNAGMKAATAAKKAAQERKFELLAQRQVVAMLGKSALLAAVFSAHFALLETLPLGLNAGLAYSAGATCVSLAIVVLGGFVEGIVHHCFCACCCLNRGEAPQTFERAKLKTTSASLLLVGNCASWLVGLVYNDTFARALLLAEQDGTIVGEREIM